MTGRQPSRIAPLARCNERTDAICLFRSWLCKNADVLRRRRMVFSSVRCSFLLARSSPPAAHCCTGAEISQTPWFPHFCGAARDFRFMLLCVEPRVIWRPCWNEILTIFDPYTFSHTQGQRPPRLRALETFNRCPQLLQFQSCWRSTEAGLLSARSGCEHLR